MYSCPNCSKTFKTKSALSIHIKTCKGDKYCQNSDCGKLLVEHQIKYCSTRCSALVTSKGRQHSDKTRSKISKTLGGSGIVKELNRTKKCLYCGKHVYNKFCNNTCKNLYHRKQKIEDWLSGKDSGTQKGGYKPFIKNYLLEKHNYKCSGCGWSEKNPVTNNIPLEVEHIDGNAYNNRPENLDLICPNCHSLTKSYRGSNKGNGRRSYLKKYYMKDDKGNIISG